MASPFPGMDPYLESRHFWPGFHTNLATEIQAALNRTIRPRYVADVTAYQTYDVIEVAQPRSFTPDVAGLQHRPPRGEGAVAVAAPPAAPAESRIPLEIEVRLHRVEIRTSAEDQLVTVIEILSPVNKRPGHEAQ